MTQIFNPGGGGSGSGGSMSVYAPVYAMPLAHSFATLEYNSNTTLYGGLYSVPVAIAVTKLWVQTTSEVTPGTFNIAVFTENGQTRKISSTFTTNGSTLLYSATCSATTIGPGNYWVFVQPTSTADCTFNTIGDSGIVGGIANGSSGIAIAGRITGATASTMPSTITPSAVSVFSGNDGVQVRLEA
jgi:hypothetical protein